MLLLTNSLRRRRSCDLIRADSQSRMFSNDLTISNASLCASGWLSDLWLKLSGHAGLLQPGPYKNQALLQLAPPPQQNPNFKHDSKRTLDTSVTPCLPTNRCGPMNAKNGYRITRPPQGKLIVASLHVNVRVFTDRY